MFSEHKTYTVWMIVGAAVMVILSLIFVGKAFLAGNAIEDADFAPQSFDVQKETPLLVDSMALARAYVQKKGVGDALSPEGRDIFHQYVEENVPDEPFAIKKIVYEPFVFMYMGFIEKSANEVIAQINWSSQTHFVRIGEKIKEWTIVRIERDKVEAINEQGESIELPIQKKVMSKKPFATVTLYATDQDRKITIGDSILGYKVLDITRDTVILTSDTGPLTISK